MAKKKNNVYTDEIRQEAVELINEQGYTVPEAAKSLNISPKLLYSWRDRGHVLNMLKFGSIKFLGSWL